MNSSDFRKIVNIKMYCVKIRQLTERFGEDIEIFVSDDAYRLSVSMALMQIGELANGLT